jgi:signal peptidase I
MTRHSVAASDVQPGGRSSELDEPTATMRLRTVVLITVAVAGLLLLATQVTVPQRVEGRSMESTLTSGEVILVDRVTPRLTPPEIGELVVVTEPGGEIVKRVVAVGGQSVGIEDGYLTVNGTVIDEPWVDEAALDSTYFGPVVVPAGTVFVMGDNRKDSIDSRMLGPVPDDQVVGIVRARAWPLDRAGGL